MDKLQFVYVSDVVNVVRCRDCKWWVEQPSDEKLGGFGFCKNLSIGCDGNEFCSDGERREATPWMT